MAMELRRRARSPDRAADRQHALAACETVAELEALGRPAAERADRGPRVEEKDDEPIEIPRPIADLGKRALTFAQMGFYDRVMSLPSRAARTSPTTATRYRRLESTASPPPPSTTTRATST
ncbi:MAG: hypothetical protein U0359_23770 [Byssovorax sp.]